MARTMELHEPLVAHTAMLIRRSALDCYEAFVDPAITAKFWFTDGSGRLESGKSVTWNWRMYGMSSDVRVRELVPGRKIVVEWDVDTDDASTVEWTFAEIADGSTFVEIRNFGFTGDYEHQVERVVDSMGGFSLVIAGAKAWLEHGVRLNLVEDRHPDMLVRGWKAERRETPDPAPDERDELREATPEPDTERVRVDDVSPADALDQSRTVRPTARYQPPVLREDADVADALDQAREVVFDDEAEPHLTS
jgi:uncharacterized protein YndB with AHSA1/START domain